MKEEFYLRRLEKKPPNKVNGTEVSNLLLLDIKALLEQLVTDKGKNKPASIFKRIFK